MNIPLTGTVLNVVRSEVVLNMVFACDRISKSLGPFQRVKLEWASALMDLGARGNIENKDLSTQILEVIG